MRRALIEEPELKVVVAASVKNESSREQIVSKSRLRRARALAD
jgi:hypothetical protein